MNIVAPPAHCSGAYSDCVKRRPSLKLSEFYRGQMRGFAGFWRRRHEIAALLGKSVAEIAETDLGLARMYRDSAAKEKAAGR